MLRNCLAWFAWGLIGGLMVLGSRPARADTTEEKLRCVDAYEQSQRNRRDGRLLAAREQLVACSQEACPDVVRNDCSTWLAEVQGAIPSVVVSARSRSGVDLLDARVLIDGTPVAGDQRGKASDLDPGEHRIQVEVEGYVPFDRTIVVAEGEKHRSVIATLEKPRQDLPGPALPPLRPTPLAGRPYLAIPIVSGAVGVAGAVGLTYFGLEARKGDKALDDCRPTCTTSQVSDVKRDYRLANVSLGVGAAGVTGTLVWLIVTNPRADDSSRRLWFDWQARPTGGSAVVHGRF